MSFDCATISICACIKGYHAYKIRPVVGEECSVREETNNSIDPQAIGIYRGNLLMGHVPAKPVPLHVCLRKLMEKYNITWCVLFV